MTLPSPPIPADADLTHFPDMPLDVARLRESGLAAEGNPADNWYALLLWAAAFHQRPAGSLPNNDRQLAYLAGLGRDLRHWSGHKEGALRGWIECSDGRLYHPVLAAKVLLCLGKSAKGKRLSSKRWSGRNEQPTENAQHQKCQSNTDAALLRREGKGIEEKTPPLDPPPGDAPEERSSSKRGTRLPADWNLPTDWRLWAEQYGAPKALIDREAECFKDFWHGRAGAIARKLDWLATWRNWIRDKVPAQSGAPLFKQAGPIDIELEEWGPRIRRCKRDGFWMDVWGPPWGKPGCRIPKRLTDQWNEI